MVPLFLVPNTIYPSVSNIRVSEGMDRSSGVKVGETSFAQDAKSTIQEILAGRSTRTVGLFLRWRLGHISTSSQKGVISRLTIVMRFVGLGSIEWSNANGKERLFACQANAVASANLMSMRH